MRAAIYHPRCCAPTLSGEQGQAARCPTSCLPFYFQWRFFWVRNGFGLMPFIFFSFKKSGFLGEASSSSRTEMRKHTVGAMYTYHCRLMRHRDSPCCGHGSSRGRGRLSEETMPSPGASPGAELSVPVNHRMPKPGYWSEVRAHFGALNQYHMGSSHLEKMKNTLQL